MARYDYRYHRCGRFEILRPAPDAVPPLALPPEPHNALLGSLDGPAAEEAAREAARTAPPRENGGNQYIKNLTRGARIYLPVSSTAASSPSVTCTSARATARSPSAVRSRWAATWTCGST